MEKKNKEKFMFIIIFVILLILIDQISKIYVINNITDSSINVIKNILNFTYVENTGVAFGINSNNNLYNIIASIIVIILLIRFMVNQKDTNSKPTNISLSLIISGGLSNLIDRMIRGKVIDFIDISPILKFPAFNLADIYIVIGWVMFAFLIAKYTTTIKFRKSKYIEK